MTRDKVENLLDELKEEHSSEPENQFQQNTGSSAEEDSWDSGSSTGTDREWFEGKPSSGDTEVYEQGGGDSISGNSSLTGEGSNSFLMVDEKLEKNPKWTKDFSMNVLLPSSGKKASSRGRVDENGKEEKLVVTVEDGEVTAHIFSKNR